MNTGLIESVTKIYFAYELRCDVVVLESFNLGQPFSDPLDFNATE